MGESKKRKTALGEKYGTLQEAPVFFGLTPTQLKKINEFVTTGTWVCIGLVIAIWIAVRIGAWQGWWGVK